MFNSRPYVLLAGALRISAALNPTSANRPLLSLDVNPKPQTANPYISPIDKLELQILSRAIDCSSQEPRAGRHGSGCFSGLGVKEFGASKGV